MLIARSVSRLLFHLLLLLSGCLLATDFPPSLRRRSTWNLSTDCCSIDMCCLKGDIECIAHHKARFKANVVSENRKIALLCYNCSRSRIASGSERRLILLPRHSNIDSKGKLSSIGSFKSSLLNNLLSNVVPCPAQENPLESQMCSLLGDYLSSGNGSFFFENPSVLNTIFLLHFYRNFSVPDRESFVACLQSHECRGISECFRTCELSVKDSRFSSSSEDRKPAVKSFNELKNESKGFFKGRNKIINKFKKVQLKKLEVNKNIGATSKLSSYFKCLHRYGTQGLRDVRTNQECRNFIASEDFRVDIQPSAKIGGIYRSRSNQASNRLKPRPLSFQFSTRTSYSSRKRRQLNFNQIGNSVKTGAKKIPSNVLEPPIVEIMEKNISFDVHSNVRYKNFPNNALPSSLQKGSGVEPQTATMSDLDPETSEETRQGETLEGKVSTIPSFEDLIEKAKLTSKLPFTTRVSGSSFTSMTATDSREMNELETDRDLGNDGVSQTTPLLNLADQNLLAGNEPTTLSYDTDNAPESKTADSNNLDVFSDRNKLSQTDFAEEKTETNSDWYDLTVGEDSSPNSDFTLTNENSRKDSAIFSKPNPEYDVSTEYVKYTLRSLTEASFDLARNTLPVSNSNHPSENKPSEIISFASTETSYETRTRSESDIRTIGSISGDPLTKNGMTTMVMNGETKPVSTSLNSILENTKPIEPLDFSTSHMHDITATDDENLKIEIPVISTIKNNDPGKSFVENSLSSLSYQGGFTLNYRYSTSIPDHDLSELSSQTYPVQETVINKDSFTIETNEMSDVSVLDPSKDIDSSPTKENSLRNSISTSLNTNYATEGILPEEFSPKLSVSPTSHESSEIPNETSLEARFPNEEGPTISVPKSFTLSPKSQAQKGNGYPANSAVETESNTFPITGVDAPSTVYDKVLSKNDRTNPLTDSSSILPAQNITIGYLSDVPTSNDDALKNDEKRNMITTEGINNFEDPTPPNGKNKPTPEEIYSTVGNEASSPYLEIPSATVLLKNELSSDSNKKSSTDNNEATLDTIDDRPKIETSDLYPSSDKSKNREPDSNILNINSKESNSSIGIDTSVSSRAYDSTEKRNDGESFKRGPVVGPAKEVIVTEQPYGDSNPISPTSEYVLNPGGNLMHQSTPPPSSPIDEMPNASAETESTNAKEDFSSSTIKYATISGIDPDSKAIESRSSGKEILTTEQDLINQSKPPPSLPVDKIPRASTEESTNAKKDFLSSTIKYATISGIDPDSKAKTSFSSDKEVLTTDQDLINQSKPPPSLPVDKMPRASTEKESINTKEAFISSTIEDATISGIDPGSKANATRSSDKVLTTDQDLINQSKPPPSLPVDKMPRASTEKESINTKEAFISSTIKDATISGIDPDSRANASRSNDKEVLTTDQNLMHQSKPPPSSPIGEIPNASTETESTNAKGAFLSSTIEDATISGIEPVSESVFSRSGDKVVVTTDEALVHQSKPTPSLPMDDMPKVSTEQESIHTKHTFLSNTTEDPAISGAGSTFRADTPLSSGEAAVTVEQVLTNHSKYPPSKQIDGEILNGPSDEVFLPSSTADASVSENNPVSEDEDIDEADLNTDHVLVRTDRDVSSQVSAHSSVEDGDLPSENAVSEGRDKTDDTLIRTEREILPTNGESSPDSKDLGSIDPSGGVSAEGRVSGSLNGIDPLDSVTVGGSVTENIDSVGSFDGKTGIAEVPGSADTADSQDVQETGVSQEYDSPEVLSGPTVQSEVSGKADGVDAPPVQETEIPSIDKGMPDSVPIPKTAIEVPETLNGDSLTDMPNINLNGAISTELQFETPMQSAQPRDEIESDDSLPLSTQIPDTDLTSAGVSVWPAPDLDPESNDDSFPELTSEESKVDANTVTVNLKSTTVSTEIPDNVDQPVEQQSPDFSTSQQEVPNINSDTLDTGSVETQSVLPRTVSPTSIESSDELSEDSPPKRANDDNGSSTDDSSAPTQRTSSASSGQGTFASRAMGGGDGTDPSTESPDITFHFTIDADYDEVVGDRKEEFEESLTKQLTVAMRVPSECIQNLQVSRGSIEVNFEMVPNPDYGHLADADALKAAAEEIKRKIDNGQLTIKDLKGNALIVIPIDPPTTPPPVTQSEHTTLILGVIIGAFILTVISVVITAIVVKRKASGTQRLSPIEEARSKLPSYREIPFQEALFMKGSRNTVMVGKYCYNTGQWLGPGPEPIVYEPPDSVVYTPPSENEIRSTPRPPTVVRERLKKQWELDWDSMVFSR